MDFVKFSGYTIGSSLLSVVFGVFAWLFVVGDNTPPHNALFTLLDLLFRFVPMLISAILSAHIFLRRLHNPKIIIIYSAIISIIWIILDLRTITYCTPKDLCPNFILLTAAVTYFCVTLLYIIKYKNKLSVRGSVI